MISIKNRKTLLLNNTLKVIIKNLRSVLGGRRESQLKNPFGTCTAYRSIP